MPDAIHISKLKLRCHIGVPEEERAEAQVLLVSFTLFPFRDFRDLGDDLANTIDYAAVCGFVQVIAASHPRKLVETLAEDIAQGLLGEYPIAATELELRKFILPETEYVAIRLRRERR